ncbi:MAG TPA: AMP-binding protein [Microthrixaceae bacterium]|nr:AMP-binding protein [Microthrixaceae bacterium]
MADWALAAVHDVVAAAVPDRDMLICGEVRRTFGEVRDRSRGLASFFVSRGLGTHTDRSELERWENGQDPVALVLHNGTEYIEAMLGAYRARAVPFNVNQHYRPAELAALLTDVGPRAVVYHRRYGPLLTAACDRSSVDTSELVLVDVDDGSGFEPLPGSTPYEQAVSTPVGDLPEPSPDDLYLVCTGGTTGRPKAVLWRQADIYCAAMAGTAEATADSIAATARDNQAGPWYAVPPLMHAAAQWTAFSGLHAGAPVLVHEDATAFDAARVLGIAERERASMMSLVGDAHVRPVIDELRRHPYDLSAMGMIGTGGAVTSEHLVDELLELLPHVLVVEGYGASETGGMAYGGRVRGAAPAPLRPAVGATVVSADLTRELDPGDDEIGWTARRGRVPLGYLGDRDTTEATFPIVAGERLSIPGDRARRRADESIEVLGRDSLVVNTGGEKVFVEEVELALLTHPDVADALVVGRPSERFGQEVVAVVAPRQGAALDPAELREFVAARIARFKAPRAIAVCASVRRHASGKADYRWAKEVAADAVEATGNP